MVGVEPTLSYALNVRPLPIGVHVLAAASPKISLIGLFKEGVLVIPVVLWSFAASGGQDGIRTRISRIDNPVESRSPT